MVKCGDTSCRLSKNHIDNQFKKQKVIQLHTEMPTMKMDKHTLASFTINQIDKHGGSSNYLNDPWHPFQPTRTLVCRVICKKEYLDVPTLVSLGPPPLHLSYAKQRTRTYLQMPLTLWLGPSTELKLIAFSIAFNCTRRTTTQNFNCKKRTSQWLFLKWRSQSRTMKAWPTIYKNWMTRTNMSSTA